MISDAKWQRVNFVIENFSCIMEASMMASLGGAVGDAMSGLAEGVGEALGGSPAPAPARDRDAMLRAIVEGGRQSGPDAEAIAKVRAGITDTLADEIISLCDGYARELPPLSASLTTDQLVAYVRRGDQPDDPAFRAFMSRFMAIGEQLRNMSQ